ncbi:cytochrome c5 family protein [Ideonella sp. 4Y11]|uniref:Cytochrome c5 family protein n=1 Tax=Ideonella aquatica TaxID=2824119 RepID=A0A941BJ14_9BURK|nr:c-type cytochrome [Ideonella aquatica]MBQ0958393.1 cytochrome c5 family protein [Ideonella aquatica]
MTKTLLGLALCAPLLAAAADGPTVYNQNCAMCHVPGLANAPKFGDKAAWAPRLETGRDALLASALKGKGAMPPKAGNPKLSDEEVASALDHLLASVR